MNLSEQARSDILFIQEPYLYNSKNARISTKNRIYTSHEDRSRAATVINNRRKKRLLEKTELREKSTKESTSCSPPSRTQYTLYACKQDVSPRDGREPK